MRILTGESIQSFGLFLGRRALPPSPNFSPHCHPLLGRPWLPRAFCSCWLRRCSLSSLSPVSSPQPRPRPISLIEFRSELLVRLPFVYTPHRSPHAPSSLGSPGATSFTHPLFRRLSRQVPFACHDYVLGSLFSPGSCVPTLPQS